MAKGTGMRPGQRPPGSGQYEMVGPRGGRTGIERTVVKNEPLPPARKEKGRAWCLPGYSPSGRVLSVPGPSQPAKRRRFPSGAPLIADGRSALNMTSDGTSTSFRRSRPLLAEPRHIRVRLRHGASLIRVQPRPCFGGVLIFAGQ